MKKIAIITSGGEGPGINHAVQEFCLENSLEVWGFHGGFDGIAQEKGFLITKENCKSSAISGKQIVRSARSKKTFSAEGRKEIIEALKKMNMDCLIVCGGNGSLEGAKLLTKEGFPTIFIPMSVDNDIDYTEYSIGYNTTLNSFIEIIQNIHNSSYNMPKRIFMVEVPGGNCGQLALATGIAGNADIIILPEYCINHHTIAKKIHKKYEEENYIIIVCAETAYEKDVYVAGNQGISFTIGKEIEKETGIKMRHCVTGFYTRGSQPCYQDCYMASCFASKAIENIQKDSYGVMIGTQNGRITEIEYNKHYAKKKELDKNLIDMAKKKDVLILGGE